MSKLTERDLSQINEGQMSDLVLRNLAPHLRAVHDQTIAKLKQDYRAGTLEHLPLLAGIAGLCALDDLEARLKASIAVGIEAGKKLE